MRRSEATVEYRKYPRDGLKEKKNEYKSESTNGSLISSRGWREYLLRTWRIAWKHGLRRNWTTATPHGGLYSSEAKQLA